MTRATWSKGRNPIRNVFRFASVQSVENAIMGTFALLVSFCAARTEPENTGPRIKDASSFNASRAAVAAPSGVPYVSFGMSVKLS